MKQLQPGLLPRRLTGSKLENNNEGRAETESEEVEARDPQVMEIVSSKESLHPIIQLFKV